VARLLAAFYRLLERNAALTPNQAPVLLGIPRYSTVICGSAVDLKEIFRRVRSLRHRLFSSSAGLVVLAIGTIDVG
jgi:hypothetical protein